MKTEAIRKLSLGTLDVSRPFDRLFTQGEAEHIEQLLSDPSSKETLKLEHFSRGGFDGETFHYAGIRRKDGSVPKDVEIRRVYQRGLVNLGFIDHPQSSLDFIRACRDSGMEIDSFLLFLVK